MMHVGFYLKHGSNILLAKINLIVHVMDDTKFYRALLLCQHIADFLETNPRPRKEIQTRIIKKNV